MNNNKRVLFICVIVFIMLFGCFLRIKAYLFNRPLWLDEILLFYNMDKYEYHQFFGQLLCIQSAPPLFMCIEKFFYSLFGMKEYSLRFFPLICSIFSIPLFYLFSKKFLKSNFSVIAANILFATNAYLMYYSQELKQYSSDVFIFLLLFVILDNLTIKNFKKKDIIFYSVITTITPLLSIPSYFVIGGWVVRELITYKKEYLNKLLISQISVFLMTIFYWVSTIQPQHKDLLNTYTYLWDQGFLTFDQLNNFKLLTHNFKIFMYPCNHTILLAILSLTGFVFIAKNYKQKEISLLLITITTVIGCSLLKIFPLFERVCLFTLPILIIFITKLLDFVLIRRKTLSFFIIAALLVSFNKYNMNYLKNICSTNIWKTRFQYIYYDGKSLMEWIMYNYKTGDIIVINDQSCAAYDYYTKYYDFYPQNEVRIPKYETPKKYQKQLNTVTKEKGKYIFYFSDDNYPLNFEKIVLKRWKKSQNVVKEENINGSYLLVIEK